MNNEEIEKCHTHTHTHTHTQFVILGIKKGNPVICDSIHGPGGHYGK